ncbi:MAG: DUF2795 domain-containing protein [Myxococcaceae bacterium]|nr:DUF2795 domain-containing protein [Myxococcaceae bacterium]MCI0670277.1 DUF2795 domain-containing protein [Myxococcaceae bacterium]
MAYGFAEDPAQSPVTHLEAVDYPSDRGTIVQAAMDNGAPTDVINLLKSLPQETYETKEDALRDLGEAARRFAIGVPHADPERDRRDIGREAFEGVNRAGTTHH